jgi:serine/threonine protein kinase
LSARYLLIIFFIFRFFSLPLSSSPDSFPPFVDDKPLGIYKKILEGKINYPLHFNEHAKDLISQLLEKDTTKRLGFFSYMFIHFPVSFLFRSVLVFQVFSILPFFFFVRFLGGLKNGVADVKNHKWFRGIDWQALYNRTIKAPSVPTVTSDADTRNFEIYQESISTPTKVRMGSSPFCSLFC